MNKIKTIFIALFLTLITGCGLLSSSRDKYDLLVDKDESCNAAWADYESNLQRRADMIPQLVAVVKGSANHEEATLVAVVQARASATQVRMDAHSGDFEDPEKLKAFAIAQNGLGTAMSRLLIAHENYPDLKANQSFHDLQTQIEGTENRILRARTEYNKVVKSFNSELRHVSGKIINPITGHEFKPRSYFSAVESATSIPVIDFGTPPAQSAITPAIK